MSTDVRNDRGFTVVETVLALGLTGLGFLALLATSDYFQSARKVIETRIAHSNLRNQIQVALAQKRTVCTGAGGTNCTVSRACSNNFRLKGGAPFVLPPAIAASLSTGAPLPINEADRVELAIGQSPAFGGGPSVTLVSSSNIPNTPTDLERTDQLLYEVLLTGTVKNQDPDEVTYAGSVLLIGHRDLIGRLDTLRTEIPFEFKMRRSNALEDCGPRLSERMIAGGTHSLDDCTLAGGMVVPSALGSLCRFRSPLSLTGYTTNYCPPGFLQSKASPLECKFDSTANSDAVNMIPPCQPINTIGAGTPVPGTPSAAMNMGSMYCEYQGVVPGVAGVSELGQCPDDPNWDPLYPRIGWDDVTSPAYTLAKNYRLCKYTFNCPPPNETVIYQPPLGDGKTPSCRIKVTNCPQTNPATWLKISTAPLICRWIGPTIPPVSNNANCQAPFKEIPPSQLSLHPELSQWTQSTKIGPTTLNYILCI